MDLFSYLLGKKAGLKKATKVIANPELTGTEDDLTGLQVGNTKYKVDNLEHYSTNEQVVGTWIDGKPIYRKVFTDTKISGTPLQFTVTDFKQLINAFGFIKVDDNGTFYTYPIPYYESSSSYIRFQINSGVRLYSSNGTFINGEVTMVVEYTKTTD